MKRPLIEAAGHPLRETCIRRAWSDARPGEFIWIVGGFVATLALTTIAVRSSLFVQPPDLGDALLYLEIPLGGGLISGLVRFTWFLVRAPFRQRDEARAELEGSRVDPESLAIAKLDAVQLSEGVTGTRALLLIKNELTYGIARAGIAKRIGAKVGMEVEATRVVEAFTDADVMEIADTTTRPYRLSEFGRRVCWRLDALGRDGR